MRWLALVLALFCAPVAADVRAIAAGIADTLGVTAERQGTLIALRVGVADYCFVLDLDNSDKLDEGRRYTPAELLQFRRPLTEAEAALCDMEPSATAWVVSNNPRSADNTRPLYDQSGTAIDRISGGLPCSPEPVTVPWAATPRHWAVNAAGQGGLVVCEETLSGSLN